MAGFAIALFVGVMVATVVNKRYAMAHHHEAVKHAAVR